ncbi:MAG: hypothetical protein H0X25_22335, partial [Acidobacteriales bacterium]|nr:hypothetical protein [Terriglobales bacterium]
MPDAGDLTQLSEAISLLAGRAAILAAEPYSSQIALAVSGSTTASRLATAAAMGAANAVAGVSDLTSSLAAASGAGLSGFDPTQSYTTGTIGQSLQDGRVNVMWFLSPAQRAQVKAGGTTLDLTPAIKAAIAWAGNRPIYLPAGVWSFTSLSFIGNTGGIIGDGIDITI